MLHIANNHVSGRKPQLRFLLVYKSIESFVACWTMFFWNYVSERQSNKLEYQKHLFWDKVEKMRKKMALPSYQDVE